MQFKFLIRKHLLYHHRLVFLILLAVLLVAGFFQIGQTKQMEIQNVITQVKLDNLKITVGGSEKSQGTSFFGTLTNETKKNLSLLSKFIFVMNMEKYKKT